MTKISIIIPARYASKRFPGKPLKLICGKELIVHVAEKCAKVAGNKNLYVATESKKIKNKVLEKKYKVVMTSKKCLTGTDRVAEAKKVIQTLLFVGIQISQKMKILKIEIFQK